MKMKILMKCLTLVPAAVIALGALHGQTASAQTPVVVGLNGSSTSIPLGGVAPGNNQIYSGDYQQIYSNAGLSGTTTITEIDFGSATTALSGTAESITYDLDISLSNTAVPTSTPVASFAANKGANYTTVFSGTVTKDLLANGTFDLKFPFTTNFTTNPLLGTNILMDITFRSATTIDPNGVTEFYQYNAATGGATSRIYTNSVGTVLAQPNRGLYTQFITAAVPAPEPSPAVVLLVGGLGLMLMSKRSRASQRG